MEHTNIRFTIRGLGKIDAKLCPEFAPKTVENFVDLIQSGFFTGKIFHRVIPGFMIQGGGYDEMMSDSDAAPIKGEFAANGFPANTLHHARGVLSMARTNDPNSASSQFFIMHGDAPYLDGQYAAFGMVTAGMDVVDKIAYAPTHSVGWFDDVPVDAVVIEKAEIL